MHKLPTMESLRGVSLVPVLEIASIVTVLGAIYTAALTTYRLIWHPLAKFPGPRLAAVTGWYETYYDCFLLGKFSNHIDGMHRKYGRPFQPPDILRS